MTNYFSRLENLFETTTLVAFLLGAVVGAIIGDGVANLRPTDDSFEACMIREMPHQSVKMMPIVAKYCHDKPYGKQ